jgi:hypothetical protein
MNINASLLFTPAALLHVRLGDNDDDFKDNLNSLDNSSAARLISAISAFSAGHQLLNHGFLVFQHSRLFRPYRSIEFPFIR